jgi:hypothetical protein
LGQNHKESIIMLDTTSSNLLTIPSQITGRYAAHNKLSARVRAQLAVDILDGRVEVVDLTVKQVAKLLRVSVPYINAARKPAAEALTNAWASATPDQRIEFVRRAGPETVFIAIERATD